MLKSLQKSQLRLSSLVFYKNTVVNLNPWYTHTHRGKKGSGKAGRTPSKTQPKSTRTPTKAGGGRKKTPQKKAGKGGGGTKGGGEKDVGEGEEENMADSGVLDKEVS